MAISWSSYKSVGGPVSFRAGIDITYSPTTITASTASVTVTTKIYLGASGSAFAAGGSWSVSGSDSGSGSQVSWSIGGSGGSELFATLTETVTLNRGSTKSFTINATIRPSGSWPGSVSHSRTISLPARPATPPAAPSNFKVTRQPDGGTPSVGDSRQNLSWTRNATTEAPYTSYEIRRMDQLTGYTTVGKPTGTATSFADTTTRSNRSYRYALRAVNGAGTSPWVYAEINTTPAGSSSAPSVRREPPGKIIIRRGAIPSYVFGWDIAYHNGVGQPLTIIASGISPQFDTYEWTGADPAREYKFAIRSRTENPTLVSEYSPWSDTVKLISAPLAPTGLAPASADANEEVTLFWQHNPQDTTPQTAYEIRYRNTGQTGWQYMSDFIPPGGDAGKLSTHTFPPDWHPEFITNGQTLEWQVRTWGEHINASPWSATGKVVLSTRPVAGIISPEAVWQSQQLAVTWSFHDEEGSAQTGWNARLFSGPTPDNDKMLEFRSGLSSTARTVTFNTPVSDGGTYTVGVEVRDSAHLWSQQAFHTFAVEYLPPPTPMITAAWSKDDGFATLSVDVPEPTPGVHELVETLSIQRATPDGWATVAEGLSWPETVTDMVPPLNTAVAYRVLAVSVVGSIAVGETVVETPTRWVFLNHGAGFGQVVRVYGNLSASRSFSRAKALHKLAGRALPVERAGVHRDRTYQLQATLFSPLVSDPTSTWADVEALADAAAPVCVRSPAGARLFTSVGDVSLSDELDIHSQVSIPLTVVDWSEV